MTKERRAIANASLAVLFWSTVATAFKLGLRFYSPLQLIFLASVVSLLVFGGIILLTQRQKLLVRQSGSQILSSILLGALSPTAYYLILFEAYRRLPAQVAQSLNYVWTIVLVLLAVPLLKQPLTVKKFMGILIGFSGAYVISTYGKLLSFNVDDPIGVSLALVSSIVWALFWIYNTRDGRDEVVKLFTNFVFGVVYLAIIMFIFNGFKDLKLDIHLLAPIYIGFFEMGITFYLWMRAMQLTDSSARISNLVFLSPFLSLVFIHFILGEKLFYTTFLGLLLIILGIFLQKD